MTFELDAKRLLHEDEDLLAVDKPSGLVCHGTRDPNRDHLLAVVTRFLHARSGDPGHLTLLHRLDVGTSGVVLFSRNAALDGAWGRAFAERTVAKTYLALVRAKASAFPDTATELSGYLAAGRGARGRTVAVRSGGKPALTRVRAIRTVGEYTLVEARPVTGRTHQIRVQLADFGFPILGDTLYGEDDPSAKRLFLHASTTAVTHPGNGEALRIDAPLPRGFRLRLKPRA